MADNSVSTIYGPVPSRRLGRSLGIDLVPYKVCSYDCVYCQLGRTSTLTIERDEYVSIDKVLIDLETALSNTSAVDCVTLAGSGEPTLNSGVGRLLKEIKRRYALPTAVITNGSLLWKAELRDEMLMADYVLPSLDAGDARMFKAINRPHPELDYKKMVDGIIRFVHEYEGQLSLEVMLLKYINATPIELKKIADQVAIIAPALVQINTAYRPPCESFAISLSDKELNDAISFFNVPTELIKPSLSQAELDSAHAKGEADVMAMLERRPCTLDDLCLGLSMNRLELVKLIEALIGKGAIHEKRNDNRVYLVPSDKRAESAKALALSGKK